MDSVKCINNAKRVVCTKCKDEVKCVEGDYGDYLRVSMSM